MTTQKARGLSDDPAAAEELAVASYLEHNPDFFERHTPMLTRLRLPHARSGATVSLVERQVEVLREKHAALERRLAEFVDVARANDALADRIQAFTKRLLRARSLGETVAQIQQSLVSDFDAAEARLMLRGVPAAKLPDAPPQFVRMVTTDEPALQSFETLFASGKPRCGQARDIQRDFLFGDDAGNVASVALVPLGAQGSLGLLAIASADAQRFHPGMSTEFLARMGELTTQAIQRFA